MKFIRGASFLLALSFAAVMPQTSLFAGQAAAPRPDEAPPRPRRRLSI